MLGNEENPAYGFDDDEATRRLLRSRPPREALAWAGSALGGAVVAARPLRGGRAGPFASSRPWTCRRHAC